MKILNFFLFTVLLGLPLMFMALPSILPGQVLALQPGSASWIIQQCQSGCAGFEAWTRNGLVTFLGPIGNGIGWVTIETGGTATHIAEDMFLTGGNIANPRSVSDLMANLRAHGWVRIPAREIGAATWGGPLAAALAIVGRVRRRLAFGRDGRAA